MLALHVFCMCILGKNRTPSRSNWCQIPLLKHLLLFSKGHFTLYCLNSYSKKCFGFAHEIFLVRVITTPTTTCHSGGTFRELCVRG